jgi:hypothetical protein
MTIHVSMRILPRTGAVITTRKHCNQTTIRVDGDNRVDAPTNVLINLIDDWDTYDLTQDELTILRPILTEAREMGVL